MKKYDPRNIWQRFADRHWSIYICAAVSIVSLAFVVAALTFLALGRSSDESNENSGGENRTELPTGNSGGFWQFPSVSPSISIEPSLLPTVTPTQRPSPRPSMFASVYPTKYPSIQPTNTPTVIPSAHPTIALTVTPSMRPSDTPTLFPSELPSITFPSMLPSSVPSIIPSALLSKLPSFSAVPSDKPSKPPSVSVPPTTLLTTLPSMPPITKPSETPATYQPGNLTVLDENLLLSAGLRARVLAKTGQSVTYWNGQNSVETFHGRPDFGATFPMDDGGWIYVSNSEIQERGAGGVGSLRFDARGRVVEYKRILGGTTMNCGGGRTPWNTWISCEEIIPGGQMYQVSPVEDREAAPITMGLDGGRWESFAYDVRDREHPRFFATEDHPRGALRRFVPANPNWDDPWTMLHAEGALDYLVLVPNVGQNGGTFRWTENLEEGKQSAFDFYTETEGIDVDEGRLYVVSKRLRSLFVLDLDLMTYRNMTTVHGVFDGAPDQVSRMLDDESQILYFTEEGGRDPGVHGRNSQGLYFTIFESPVYNDETTGLSFSPSGHHMYVAYQEQGILFEITRTDGLSFHARTLNVKYHNIGGTMGRL